MSSSLRLLKQLANSNVLCEAKSNLLLFNVIYFNFESSQTDMFLRIDVIKQMITITSAYIIQDTNFVTTDDISPKMTETIFVKIKNIQKGIKK